MSPPTPTQVWHDLFAVAPAAVLLDALSAGVVPVPCWSDNGRDLLTTVLCRPVADIAAARDFWGETVPNHHVPMAQMFDLPRAQPKQDGAPPSGRPLYDQTVALTQALMARPDVDPFRSQPLTGVWANTGPATALDLAVGLNLVATVDTMLARPDAPRGETLERWFERSVLSAPRTGAAPQPWVHRAVAAHRHTLVEALFDAGFDPNARDAQDLPPLFHARSQAMAQTLLERGADPQAVAGKKKTTVLEHWGQAKVRAQTGNRWQEMTAVLAAWAPTDPATDALLWFDHTAASLSWVNLQDTRLPPRHAEFQEGWARRTAVEPGSSPVATWSRTDKAGPWSGRIGWAAQLGQVLLNHPQSVVAAWLPNLEDLLRASAPDVRPNLPQWGVLGLGLFQSIAEWDRFQHQPRRVEDLRKNHPAVMALQEQSQARLRQLIAHRATPAQWLQWVGQAGAELQRLKTPALWQTVANALVNTLLVMDPAIQGEAAGARRVENALGMARAGAKLCSDSADWLVSGVPVHGCGHGVEEPWRNWFTVALVSLGDHHALGSTSTSAEYVAKRYAESLTSVFQRPRSVRPQSPRSFGGWRWDLPPELEARVGKGLAALAALNPETHALVHEEWIPAQRKQRLETTLVEPSASRRGPRL